MPKQFTCERCAAPYLDFPSSQRRFCTKSCARQGPRPFARIPLADRFWKRVQKSAGCWLWTGKLDKDGYGQGLKEGNGSRRARRPHVISWMLHNAPISDDSWVLHTCDNPPCVRPDHLYLGTVIENNRDRVERGRGATGDKSGRRLHPERWTLETRPRGSRHGRSLLTEDQVREIRLMADRVDVSHETIAEMYGVSRPTISLIVNRKTWAHI